VPRTVKVLKVENPHFTIKLSEDILKIDLKGSFKNRIEEAIENKPVLKDTVGRILGIFVPLHIRVSEIDSVKMDETRKVKINLSYHRNITIPFENKENAQKFVQKLNQLIFDSKTEKIKEHVEIKQAKKKIKLTREKAKKKSAEKKYAERGHEIFDS